MHTKIFFAFKITLLISFCKLFRASNLCGLKIFPKSEPAAFPAFAFGRRRDAHGFAVFVDGAPGNFDAFLRHQFDNLVIGKDVFRRFFINEFFYLVPDADDRSVFVAGIGSGGGREKVFQFENAAGRVHVFVSGNPTDRAFVHFQRFGNVPEQKRFEIIYALFEKIALSADDFLADPENGRCALMQGLYQKTGMAELFFQVVCRLTVFGAAVFTLAVDIEVQQT